jgi:hypothetical protein
MMESLGRWIIDIIFQPGSSLRLVPAINGSLLALLLLLAWAAWYEVIPTVHLAVLAFLSVGLMASVSWFASEFLEAKKKAENGQNALRPDMSKSSIDDKED